MRSGPTETDVVAAHFAFRAARLTNISSSPDHPWILESPVALRIWVESVFDLCAWVFEDFPSGLVNFSGAEGRARCRPARRERYPSTAFLALFVISFLVAAVLLVSYDYM